MRTTVQSIFFLCSVSAAIAQGWGRMFDPGLAGTVLGSGIDATPLANGGTLVFAQEREFLVKLAPDGSVLWERRLSGCGSIDALTEQANGDFVGVCYVDMPGALSGETYPVIFRMDSEGQMLWGTGYSMDSVWTVWPTQVINADLDEFYVLYMGMNTHRLAKFEANGTMLWTHDFTGTGFGVFGAHIPGGNLHLFNGPLEIVIAPDGTLVWEKYHYVSGWDYGFTDVLYDSGPFNHFFVMATLLQPGGSGNPYVPGIALLDTLGNVITSRTWEGLTSSSIWEQAMVISKTTLGFALACTSLDEHGYLLTCDSTLTLGSMTAHQIPFVPGSVRNGRHRPNAGMLICGTAGDHFTGDRFVFDIPVNGDVSTCFIQTAFVANSLPPEAPIPNPWPTSIMTPTLLPQAATFATIPVTLPSTPFCNSVGMAAMDPGAIRLHPNPGSGQITLEGSGLVTPLRVSISDPSGRLVRSLKIGTTPSMIQCEGIDPGHYHLRVVDADGRMIVLPFMSE
jgi:hypothetical protein